VHHFTGVRLQTKRPAGSPVSKQRLGTLSFVIGCAFQVQHNEGINNTVEIRRQVIEAQIVIRTD
jgi:Fe2+ transport system protein FeoA